MDISAPASLNRDRAVPSPDPVSVALVYAAGSVAGNFAPNPWISYADDLAVGYILVFLCTAAILQLVALWRAHRCKGDLRVVLIWLSAFAASHHLGCVVTVIRQAVSQSQSSRDCELSAYLASLAPSTAESITLWRKEHAALPAGSFIFRIDLRDSGSNSTVVGAVVIGQDIRTIGRQPIHALCFQHSANHPEDIFTDFTLPIVVNPLQGVAFIEKRDVHGDSLRIARPDVDATFHDVALVVLVVPIVTSLLLIWTSLKSRRRAWLSWLLLLAWCCTFTPWVSWSVWPEVSP